MSLHQTWAPGKGRCPGLLTHMPTPLHTQWVENTSQRRCAAPITHLTRPQFSLKQARFEGRSESRLNYEQWFPTPLPSQTAMETFFLSLKAAFTFRPESLSFFYLLSLSVSSGTNQTGEFFFFFLHILCLCWFHRNQFLSCSFKAEFEKDYYCLPAIFLLFFQWVLHKLTKIITLKLLNKETHS